MDKPFRLAIRYPLEALCAVSFYAVFSLLPAGAASAVGGWLGRGIGPRLPVSRRAHDNLKRALPETTPARRDEIVRGMWDNLGRVLAEYPHLDAIVRRIGDGGRVELVGGEHLDPIRTPRTAAIVFSGHLANWEVLARSAAELGLHLDQVYRAPNNPLLDRFLSRVRRMPKAKQVPKGTAGARRAIAALASGGQLAMLVDQKMNDGIAVPFFGRDAMTAPALAQLALKFDCIVVPARVERLHGCRFRVTVSPPLEPVRSDDRQADLRTIMGRVNDMVEQWIRQRPEQWLWLHRRWPD